MNEQEATMSKQGEETKKDDKYYEGKEKTERVIAKEKREEEDREKNIESVAATTEVTDLFPEELEKMGYVFVTNVDLSMRRRELMEEGFIDKEMGTIAGKYGADNVIVNKKAVTLRGELLPEYLGIWIKKEAFEAVQQE